MQPRYGSSRDVQSRPEPRGRVVGAAPLEIQPEPRANPAGLSGGQKFFDQPAKM
jgi:hypothetical protein